MVGGGRREGGRGRRRVLVPVEVLVMAMPAVLVQIEDGRRRVGGRRRLLATQASFLAAEPLERGRETSALVERVARRSVGGALQRRRGQNLALRLMLAEHGNVASGCGGGG